ncbi:hypothetical protein chiPu_0033114, partial [Chiloscyllium punctatum]|nr:hypothetical protein [Chiloscyllium punctatum]
MDAATNAAIHTVRKMFRTVTGVAAPPDNKRSDRLPRCDERIRRCTFGRARNSPRPRQTRQYYSNSRQCRWRDSAAAEGASGS